MNDVKYVYKAHPITIFNYLKPFLFVLLLPVLKALSEALMKREVNGIILNEVIAAMAIIVYSTIKWKKFKFTVSKNEIEISTGLIFNSISIIQTSKISSIEEIRSIGDYILGSTTLKINTEAGRTGKSDYEIRLFCKDADKVRKILVVKESEKSIKFSAVRVAVMAATASSAFAGLIVVVPIIKKIGDLLGTAIEKTLFEKINEVSSILDNYIPHIINTVTVIFLLLYGISFLVTFFRCVNFRIKIGNEKMIIKSGLLTHRKITFGIKPVNSIVIEQTPFMRCMKRFLIRVGIAGYGDKKGDKAIIVPSAKKTEVKDFFAILFPNMKISEDFICPDKKSQKRFYNIPTVFFVISLVCCVLLKHFFPVFNDLINFVSVVCLVIIFYYYYLAGYNAKNSKISVSKVIYAKYTRWSAIREMYCDAEKVGIIRITKWPADFKYGTCNIKLIVRSESSESITVKHINYKIIQEEFAKFYGYE